LDTSQGSSDDEEEKAEPLPVVIAEEDTVEEIEARNLEAQAAALFELAQKLGEESMKKTAEAEKKAYERALEKARAEGRNIDEDEEAEIQLEGAPRGLSLRRRGNRKVLVRWQIPADIPKGEVGPYVIQWSEEPVFPPGNREELQVPYPANESLVRLIKPELVPLEEKVLYFRMRLHPAYEYSIVTKQWTVQSECGDLKYFDTAESDDFLHWTCKDCPELANCSRGTWPHVVDSVWRVPWEENIDLSFVDCPFGHACLYNETVAQCGRRNGSCSGCVNGNTGVMCALCADGYSKKGEFCESCDGGAKNASGFIIFGALLPIGIIFSTLIVFVRLPNDVGAELGDEDHLEEELEELVAGEMASNMEGTSAGGRSGGRRGRRGGRKGNREAPFDLGAFIENNVKLLLGHLQVFSSLNVSFQIPWPPMFVSLLDSIKVVNIDVMSIFQPLSPCAFSMSFLNGFYAHMLLLPLLILSLKVSEFCGKRSKKKKKTKIGIKSIKFKILFVFILYPGIGQRIFQVMDCQEISGRFFLRADYAVSCFEGEHFIALFIAIACMFLYVIGIPLGLIIFLGRKRKQLRSPSMVERFGGVYIAYTAGMWWFEAFEMIKKVILVGGIVLISPGSTSQILLAFLIAFIFFSVIMGSKPYEEGLSTKLQALTTGQLLLSIVLGLVLALSADNDTTAAEAAFIDTLLVGSSLIVFFVSMYMLIAGIHEKVHAMEKHFGKRTKRILYLLTCQCVVVCCCTLLGRRKKDQIKVTPTRKKDQTKVTPTGEEESKVDDEQAKKLRELQLIRQTHGAGSQEYMAMMQGVTLEEYRRRETGKKRQEEAAENDRAKEREREKNLENERKATMAKREAEEREGKLKKAAEEERRIANREAHERQRKIKTAEDEQRRLAEAAEKDRIEAIEKKRRELKKQIDLLDELHHVCYNIDDPDQYLHVKEAVKKVEKAQSSGLLFPGDLQEKLASLNRRVTRLERAYKLRQMVLNLNSKTLAELKSYKDPDPTIVLALKGAMILLGSNVGDLTSWSKIKVLMGKTGRESLKRKISTFTPKTVSPELLAQAKKCIGQIDHEAIQRASQGAYIIYAWSTGIIMQIDNADDAHMWNKIKSILKVSRAASFKQKKDEK
jgi:flagellar biosynthesis GTPase FlhF